MHFLIFFPVLKKRCPACHRRTISKLKIDQYEDDIHSCPVCYSQLVFKHDWLFFHLWWLMGEIRQLLVFDHWFFVAIEMLMIGATYVQLYLAARFTGLKLAPSKVLAHPPLEEIHGREEHEQTHP